MQYVRGTMASIDTAQEQHEPGDRGQSAQPMAAVQMGDATGGHQLLEPFALPAAQVEGNVRVRFARRRPQLQDNRVVSYRMNPVTERQTDPEQVIERGVEMRGRLQSSENTRPRKPSTRPAATQPAEREAPRDPGAEPRPQAAR